MQVNPTYTLGKQERLKSRKAIEQLFSQGRSFSLFPFKIICQQTRADIPVLEKGAELRCAFSVSKKYFKKSADRNRIKRLMREAYRLQKTGLKETIEKNNQLVTIFLLYVGNELPEYRLVFDKMGAIIKRLQKIMNEEASYNT